MFMSHYATEVCKCPLRCPFAKIGINNATKAKTVTALTLLPINLFFIRLLK